jgi:hypothetical protein
LDNGVEEGDVFRPFSEELKTIAKNIECFLSKQYSSYKTVVLKPFSLATIITYVNKMAISDHLDQTFKKDGYLISLKIIRFKILSLQFFALVILDS